MRFRRWECMYDAGVPERSELVAMERHGVLCHLSVSLFVWRCICLCLSAREGTHDEVRVAAESTCDGRWSCDRAISQGGSSFCECGWRCVRYCEGSDINRQI
ncbi:hypothetical protein Tco_0563804 [Tanacetum coccineum]